jgi:hypothetical protein
MANIGGVAKVTQRAIWVLMLTIVPIGLISAVWDSIVDYIPLFFSVVFLMGSGIFMFFYIKFYDYHSLLFKIRRFFSAKESMDEYMFRRFRGEQRHRSKSFLLISIGLMFLGGYMMYRHFNPPPTEVDVIYIDDIEDQTIDYEYAE